MRHMSTLVSNHRADNLVEFSRKKIQFEKLCIVLSFVCISYDVCLL